MTSYWLVRRPTTAPRWALDEFARAVGLHPQLVSRLVRLGLLSPVGDGAGGTWFVAADLARAARIQRLRVGLGLNYAAVGVVLDLLDRIDELDAQVRDLRASRRR